ncbi:hypothetical protein [Mucilaginibacter lappiensis]|uniref:Uncharacterized protein n=1 Tax=Mucilaginibacter lappiensis TaxID=354630 RepID=A0A841J718_9SPHI|nr:hypothetical protein [Mucilaginibacter lappiensis]MBB6126979.1 hypothetical protein [Mucilaginibacter lappiensis]
MAGRYRNARSGDEIERDWKEQDLVIKAREQQDKYVREHYLRIAAKAREERVWLFDPVVRAWYNPDEFEATFKMYIRSPEEVYARVKFKDPFEAIEEAQTKTSEFIKRVLDYAKKISSENEANKDKELKQKK